MLSPASSASPRCRLSRRSAGGQCPGRRTDEAGRAARPGAWARDKAPVTIVEYASMTCPHCAHFQETTFPEIKKRYIDTGKVRYILRDFPLDSWRARPSCWRTAPPRATRTNIIPWSRRCSRQQRTWAVEKPVPPLLAIAKQAGLSEKRFQRLPVESEGLGCHGKRAPARHEGVQGRVRRRHFSSMGRRSPAPSRSRKWPR